MSEPLFDEEEEKQIMPEICFDEDTLMEEIEQLLIEYLDEDEAEFLIDELRGRLPKILLRKQAEFAH